MSTSKVYNSVVLLMAGLHKLEGVRTLFCNFLALIVANQLCSVSTVIVVTAMENVTQNKIVYVSCMSTCEHLIVVLICNVYVHAYAASLVSCGLIEAGYSYQ